MYDVIIIGAGPAGASAGIFTAKAGLKTLVIDNDTGMTKRAWLLNFYGIEDIGGPEMVDIGQKQLKNLGAELIAAKATDIAEMDGGLTVTTEQGGTYEGKHVIVATGAAVALAQESGLTVIPGTEPRIKFVVETDEAGRTSTPGVWAAGTVAGVSVHAIITAGDGARVAINVISEIKGERYVDHDMLTAKGEKPQ
jgi:thioredoxin reductase (NADPH)